jgi:alkylhydroperoxidase family enzyme
MPSHSAVAAACLLLLPSVCLSAPSPVAVTQSSAAGDEWAPLNQEAWPLPAVARLRELDPVTTEVVRLRGAVAHNCRLCKSLRESGALDAGGSESLYDDIERYESSHLLTDAHKAALRYADALIWTPSDIEHAVAAGVTAHFTAGQARELTLDVMRNASNKIAVALKADAPRVEQGTERYLIDADGQTVYS